MTYNKKTIPFVFAFAALMLAWPMATQPANADGDIVIPGICGITVVGGDFALPNLTAGGETAESSVFTITTDGNTAGTFEIVASDWVGNGETATGAVTLNSPNDLDTVTINSIVFTAEDDGAGLAEGEFASEGNANADATSLAAQINAHTGAVNVQATARENVVLLRSDAIGAAANDIPLAESTASARIVLSGATMLNGEAQGVKHLESTASRYSVTNTDVDPVASTYAAKAAAGSFDTDETVKKIVVTQTDPTKDIRMIWQVSGVGFVNPDQYSGGIKQTLTFTTLCN